MNEDIKDNKYQQYLEQKHSQFAVSPEVVEAAVEKAVGKKPISISRIISGEVNEVYDAGTEGDNVIVRISHNDENRFIPEKWAIDKARELGIPAPEILLIEEVEDCGKKVNVAVERKLPGISLRETVKLGKLSDEQVRDIVLKAGEILARIHSITPQKFGGLYKDGVGGHDTWKSYMLLPLRLQRVEGLLKSATKADIPKSDIDRTLRILVDNADMYKDVNPHLLHADFGPKHILIQDGKISGILDFENAKSGDPTHDFAWWSYFGKTRPPLDWLKEGYQRSGTLPDKFDLRLRLGRLRLGTDMIYYYDQEKHDMGLSIAKVNLQEDLEYFTKSK